MYREPQQNVEVSDTKFDDSDGDILINNLVYEMPKSLSLVTNKSNYISYPDQTTVRVDRSNTIVFNWNTGNSYIDTHNSFLRFKLKSNLPTPIVAPPSFGSFSSGALNLIRESRIRTRSGVEVSRVENSNLYNVLSLNYTKTKAWIDTIGSSFYMNSLVSPFNVANTQVSEVCIPLIYVDPFFRSLKDQLLPAQLASGLRVELSLESLARAFVDTTAYFGVASSVDLTDISMSLSCVHLSEETLKILNLESSQSGLEWTYSRVHNMNGVYAQGTNAINLQISKAVSQSTHVMTQISPDANTQLSTANSFASEAFKVTSWNYRLGSNYYPNQQVIDAAGLNAVQSYLLALSSHDKLKGSYQESSMTLSTFRDTLSTLAVSLSRDSALAVSGQPINNSRILELQMTRDGALDTGKLNVNAFLCYISVAKAFIDNVSVAI